MDGLNDSPNSATLKVPWGYGQKVPHLAELPVPDGKGIVEKIYNNVFDIKSPPWAVRWNRPFSLRHADQCEDFLGEKYHNTASQSEKSLASLGCIVALDGQSHLHNAPAHQNDAHGLNQAENEAGQVGNNGNGVRCKGADGQPQCKQSEESKGACRYAEF